MCWGGGRCLGYRNSKEIESPLFTCLDECRASLTSWNNNSFGHVGKILAAMQARLKVLECKRGPQPPWRKLNAQEWR